MIRVILAWAFAGVALAAPVELRQYHPYDFRFTAPENGNPFDTELAGEFSGPAGAHLRIRGFYDGGGTWKIRFAPPAPGKWLLRNLSDVSALDGKVAEAHAAPNAVPQIHGPLRVDSEHPFHFRFEDGARFFLRATKPTGCGAPTCSTRSVR